MGMLSMERKYKLEDDMWKNFNLISHLLREAKEAMQKVLDMHEVKNNNNRVVKSLGKELEIG